MKKSFITIIVLVAIILVAILLFGPIEVERGPTEYKSDQFGLSFSYPETYFVAYEQSTSGERNQQAIVLAEDTPANRALFTDPDSATEGPPTITITIFQNNFDNYTLQSFVEGTNFSNFKMSNGTKTETTVGGQPAWRYRATGLYENENVVVARPDYIYMFTAFFNSPTDSILSDFDEILKTVKFNSVVLDSIDDSGSVSKCLPDSRKAEVCAQVYEPVCANVQIQCITTPCNLVPETFSNSCEACKNSLVEGYTAGVCKD